MCCWPVLVARCTLKTVIQNVMVFVNMARYQQHPYKLQYEEMVGFSAPCVNVRIDCFELLSLVLNDSTY